MNWLQDESDTLQTSLQHFEWVGDSGWGREAQAQTYGQHQQCVC